MEITKETIKEIAYVKTPIEIDQSECFLIETFLLELFYYSKKENKIILIEPTIESFADVINLFLQRLMDRNTDIWDAIFVLENNSEENKEYFEKHSFLYSELNGRKRDKEELEKLYNETLMKMQIYIAK